MTLFATPDFGATGGLILFLLIVGVIVGACVVSGIVWGAKLLKTGSPKSRKYGVCILLFSGSVPLFCCLAPPHVIRMMYGNYPIGKYPENVIRKGMSTDQVTAILGTPHERYNHGDGEHWCYWIDSFSISYFGVLFGPDGRVIATHGN